MTAPKLVGPQTLAANRRLIAERCGWPDGAADACGRLDAQWPREPYWDGTRPRWYTFWSPGPVGAEPRPGFYAVRESARAWEPPAFGATPAELVAAVEAWPVRSRTIETLDPLPLAEC